MPIEQTNQKAEQERKIEVPARGVRDFSILWAGQAVSLLGSGLTSFALGVWVFKQTESATKLAMILLTAALTSMVVYPLAGPIVDRCDRRKLLLALNAGFFLASAYLLVLERLGHLEILYICIGVAVCASLNAVQSLTLETTTVLLIPARHLGRAAGAVQTFFATAQIVSPLLGGALVGIIGLRGILYIDLATFVVAVGGLLLIRIPRAPAAVAVKEGPSAVGWHDGWRWLVQRRGLLALLFLLVAFEFASSASSVLVAPLVLSVSTPGEFGLVSAVGGAGMVLGGLLMTALPSSTRRVPWVLAAAVLGGAALGLYGLRPSLPFLVAASFLFMASIPVLFGSSDVIWMGKVPPGLQGRVFALRDMLLKAMTPVACLLVAPFVERVLGPLMRDQGFTAQLPTFLRHGLGGGAALALVVIGAATVLVVSLVGLNARLRRVEQELPEASAAAALPLLQPTPAPLIASVRETAA